MSKKKCTDGRRNNSGSKKHQWKPGESGNPNGRPKGSKSKEAMLKEELFQEIILTENGVPKKITKLQALMKVYINYPLQKGDKTSVSMIPRIISLAYEHIIEDENSEEKQEFIDLSHMTIEEKKELRRLLLLTELKPSKSSG